MLLLAEGIPALPDLTHPQELLNFGRQILEFKQWLLWLLVGLGLVLAALYFSYYRNREVDSNSWLDRLMTGYGQLVRGLFHVLLVVSILVGGFFLSSTLANRYHHWEQDKISRSADTVAGERVEQPAPQVRYSVEESYTATVEIDGKPTEVEKQRQVDRFLPPSASQVDVKLTQLTDPATLRLIYQSEFASTYQVTNSLRTSESFVLEVPPPIGYTLLQDYRVERNGRRLEPQNQGEYQFPVRLDPRESTEFRVTYKAQGASRWVYNANGRSLPKFQLTVLADFPDADFASGIVPTATKPEGQGTRFNWTFAENVSVQNPFGVFTASQKFRHTGILPRLLLLAPGILLWWLLLLYLLVPLRWQDPIAASGIFFACLLALTYASRLFDAKLAWGLLFPILLLFGWGLSDSSKLRWLTLGVTFSGAILPVFAFLVPYTGLTLGIAGLISAGCLVCCYRSLRHPSPAGEGQGVRAG
jgi:hypothetical protein